MNEKAVEFLAVLESEKPILKVPEILEMLTLCLEYITLEVLEYAKRASDIENEIFDLCEKYINN